MAEKEQRKEHDKVKRRIESIDAIKGIATLMVILVHYNQNYNPGIRIFDYFQVSPTIFFVVSGYLTTLMIENNYNDKKDTKYKREFYVSRFKALAPMWYFTILLVYVVDFLLSVIGINGIKSYASKDPFAIICNLVFVNGLVPSANNSVIEGGWFIGTLIILYLLTPVIICLMNKYTDKRKVFIVTSFVSVTFLFLMKLAFNNIFIHNGFGYFSFLNHYPSYALGMLLYYEIKNDTTSKKHIYLVLPFVILIIAVIVFFSNMSIGNYLSSWLTALATYYILHYLISNENKERKIISMKILPKIGKNSYCIYLTHCFVVRTLFNIFKVFMNDVFYININNNVLYIILMPICIFLSILLGYFLKKTMSFILQKRP